MRKSKWRSSAMKKSLAILLIVSLVIVGVSAVALAAPSTNQQPSLNQQFPSSDQRVFTWPGPGYGGQGGGVTFSINNRMMGWGGAMMRCGLAILFLFCLACCVLLTIYVYKDAKRIGLRGLVWWAILVFFTTFLGLLIYLLHKQHKEYPELWRSERQRAPAGQVRVCPNCHLAQSAENVYCHACGTRIFGAEPEPAAPAAEPEQAESSENPAE